jgi:hypothetical protein
VVVAHGSVRVGELGLNFVGSDGVYRVKEVIVIKHIARLGFC